MHGEVLWLPASLSILLCLSVGALASLLSVGGRKSWYRSLRKPRFTPPERVFPVVWTALYILMGIAVAVVWKLPSSSMRSWALAIFGLQLGLNFFWSLLFFRWHQIVAAAWECLALWLGIVATILLFLPLSTFATVLLLPYLVWVTFAVGLNIGFWRVNRTYWK